MKLMNTAFLGVVLSLSGSAFAADLSKSEISLKLQKISASSPEPIQVESVENAPMDGYYQVITDKGIMYASRDGKFLLSGTVHSMSEGLKDLTKDRLMVERRKEVQALKQDFITFKSPNQQHEIIVFYDTTCGYCHKLHSELSQYLQAGITVHYAAYPRNGVYVPNAPGMKSDSYNQLQDIWCADNGQKGVAFNMSAQGSPLPHKECPNSIEQQFKFGNKIGIRGTPAIVSMDGELIVPGYVQASALKQHLDQKAP